MDFLDLVDIAIADGDHKPYGDSWDFFLGVIKIAPL
jgi:hypothetical protein